MLFIAVKWAHDDPDEPTLLYSELDDGGWEVRKVEVFRDGTASFADATSQSGTTCLGELPVPPLEAIAGDPEFEPREISRVEFEWAWDAAVRNGKCPAD